MGPPPPQICGRASSRRFLSMLSGSGAPLGRLSPARALTAVEARERSIFVMRQLVLQRQLLYAGVEHSLRLSLTSSRRFKTDPIEEELSRPELRLHLPLQWPAWTILVWELPCCWLPDCMACEAEPGQTPRTQRESLLVSTAEASSGRRLALSLLILQPSMAAKVKPSGYVVAISPCQRADMTRERRQKQSS